MAYLLVTIIFVFLGAYSIGAQVYFIRELLVVFFGNELCIGIIFALWFAGITAGALFAAKFLKHLKHIWTAFFISQAVIGIMPLAIIPVMRIIRGIFGLQPGEYLSMMQMILGTCITITPFSFMIGLIFPLACRVALSMKGEGAIQIGWVYIWESAGSLAGGLIISLFLIPRYSPLQVLMCLCCVVFMLCFFLMNKVREDRWVHLFKPLYLFLTGCIIFFLISGKVDKLESSLIHARWLTFNNHLKLIDSEDTPYENIALAEASGQYNIFGNGQFITSYPDEYRSSFKAHLFLTQHAEPGQVLLVGEGVTGLLREMLKHPVRSVDYVELDPKFIEIIRPFLKRQDSDALNDSRVSMFYVDGRQYVKECRRKYDMVIVNASDPSTAVLNRFYTINFFKEVKRILSPSGIMVIGISSSENYFGEEIGHYSGSVYRALKKVFPFVMVTPGEKNFFFASSTPGVLTDDCRVLKQRYEERRIVSNHFSPDIFQWLFQRERMVFTENALKEKSELILNTDFHPVTYFYNLILWEIFTGEKGKLNIFQKIKDRGIWWILSLFGIFLLSVFIVVWMKRKETVVFFNCIWAIGTTGYTGMALEIMLIFAFQNLYGYIYQKIGIIVALCMMGLAVGGYWARWLIKRGGLRGINIVVCLELSLCIYTVALPFIIQWLIDSSGQKESYFYLLTQYFYMAIVFGAGVLVGMEFPLISHVLINHGQTSGYVAALVDSMDHLGACAGSLLTGTMLLPLFGIYKTCIFIGLLNFSSFIFFLLFLKFRQH